MQRHEAAKKPINYLSYSKVNDYKVLDGNIEISIVYFLQKLCAFALQFLKSQRLFQRRRVGNRRTALMPVADIRHPLALRHALT